MGVRAPPKIGYRIRTARPAHERVTPSWLLSVALSLILMNGAAIAATGGLKSDLEEESENTSPLLIVLMFAGVTALMLALILPYVQSSFERTTHDLISDVPSYAKNKTFRFTPANFA